MTFNFCYYTHDERSDYLSRTSLTRKIEGTANFFSCYPGLRVNRQNSGIFYVDIKIK